VCVCSVEHTFPVCVWFFFYFFYYEVPFFILLLGFALGLP
jgi:hypothetical protein